MKRFITVLLCIALIAGTTGVFAAEEDKSNMQKILLSVKERIGETDEYPVFTGRTETNDGETVYCFSWRTDNEADEYKSLDVYVSESGIITSYYKYYYGLYENSDKPAISGISSEEAFEKAKALAATLNPDIADKLVLSNDYKNESVYNDGFSFNIQRYENGIPVLGNTGYINIDRKAEQIISFNMFYDEKTEFKAPGDVISKEKAIEEYKNKLGLILEYQNSYKDRKITVNPVYIEKYPYGKYISAYTGDVIEEEENAVIYRSGGTNMMAKEEDAAGLTIAEISELDNISGLKSKDELISIIKNNKYIKPQSTEKLMAYSTYKVGDEDKYNSNFRFADESRDIDSYSYYEMNAKTGEIINYYTYDHSDEALKTEISSKKALKYADEAVKALTGSKLSEYKEDSETEDEYSKRYIRYVNGIPYRSDSVYIGVSDKSGKITGFSVSYSEMDFPSVENALSAAEIADKVFDTVDYSLAYLVTDKKSELVYKLWNKQTLKADPFTGTLLDYNNEELNEKEITVYNDIDGHYAEDMINTLAKYGICFADPAFRPDEYIKEKDFIALLIDSIVERDPEPIGDEEKYDQFYRWAYNQKIISREESEREREITREDAVKFIIRALNAEEYAKLDGIFVSPFKDVTENIGYVALLYGMKIIGGNGSGSFNPTKPLKRADAAIMMYNCLSR